MYFIPAAFASLTHSLGVELGRVEPGRELLVLGDRDLVVVHHPFALAQEGVDAPVDEQAELRVLEPAPAPRRSGSGRLDAGDRGRARQSRKRCEAGPGRPPAGSSPMLGRGAPRFGPKEKENGAAPRPGGPPRDRRDRFRLCQGIQAMMSSARRSRTSRVIWQGIGLAAAGGLVEGDAAESAGSPSRSSRTS